MLYMSVLWQPTPYYLFLNYSGGAYIVFLHCHCQKVKYFYSTLLLNFSLLHNHLKKSVILKEKSQVSCHCLDSDHLSLPFKCLACVLPSPAHKACEFYSSLLNMTAWKLACPFTCWLLSDSLAGHRISLLKLTGIFCLDVCLYILCHFLSQWELCLNITNRIVIGIKRWWVYVAYVVTGGDVAGGVS